MRFLNCVSSNNIILAATVEHPYFSSSSSDKFISLNSDSSNFFLNCYTSNNIFIAIMTANPDFSSIPSNVIYIYSDSKYIVEVVSAATIFS